MQRRVKLGDVEFTVVEDEKPRDLVMVTDNSVESGQDVSDHVKKLPSIIDIHGQMTEEDAAEKLQILKKYQDEGELLTYIGRNWYNNMVIQTIDRDHGTRNRYGYGFTITLKQVRIATALQVPIVIIHPETRKSSPQVTTKVKEETNGGKQQVQDLPDPREGLTGLNLIRQGIEKPPRIEMNDINIIYKDPMRHFNKGGGTR